MQHHNPASVKTRRTQSIQAAGAAGPLRRSSLLVHSDALMTTPQPPLQRRSFARWLLVCALALEMLYLALLLLLSAQRGEPDPLRAFWLAHLPWLHHVRGVIEIVKPLGLYVGWLNPTTAVGFANIQLFLLCLGLGVLACAVGLVQQAAPTTRFLSRQPLVFWMICLFTLLFGATMVIGPAHLTVFSQQMLLSGFYGQLVVETHLNPYVFTAWGSVQDTFQQLLVSSQASSAPPIPLLSFGPVWLDSSILLILATHQSVPLFLLSMRLAAALGHLLSVVLLWHILSQAHPAVRNAATLFYAWNPLILLLGIFQVHQEMLLIPLILLAIFFFQRNALLLSWVFLLLASLVNFAALLLLPLFLCAMGRRMRFIWWFWSTCWWLGLFVISLLVFVLAYIPYWQGGDLVDLQARLIELFLPTRALGSLDATLLQVPLRLPALIPWLAQPEHWMLFTLLVVIISLLCTIWLVDTIEWVLACSCIGLFLLVIFLPTYWPWYVFFPLILALCSTRRSPIQLAVALLFGALLNYYFWERHLVWPGQGLVTVGLPCLLWGWIWFFTSIWERLRAREMEGVVQPVSRPLRLIRPPWLSRPQRGLSDDL
ncbi:hypothetical protein [Tengunoibacter tsumagoiensis]|uniref:DUF2029 domain-containing protein n=1 Tax=Tengunoibacter tsumagoiensis TaxID=2014871 RepID=A0A401ZU61_9CHLR|nr:hypothetical protein [Tengunoibacter tsumagoiensis]GCE10336.1 hypothetical protein KTT_01950 [Tengunoibacter tsumagoiensis]